MAPAAHCILSHFFGLFLLLCSNMIGNLRSALKWSNFIVRKSRVESNLIMFACLQVINRTFLCERGVCCYANINANIGTCYCFFTAVYAHSSILKYIAINRSRHTHRANTTSTYRIKFEANEKGAKA